jgi:hypothetical protein
VRLYLRAYTRVRLGIGEWEPIVSGELFDSVMRAPYLSTTEQDVAELASRLEPLDINAAELEALTWARLGPEGARSSDRLILLRTSRREHPQDH